MVATLQAFVQQALKKFSLLLVALLCLGSLQAEAPKATTATPDEVYHDAVAELEKGNFTKAQYLAESLIKKTPPQLSSEAFQIIGHARYRQGDLGRAALWYLRAQLLDNHSPELRQNLRHLYDKTKFVSFKNDSPLREASYLLTMNQWLMLAAVGLWMILLPLAWLILKGRIGSGWPVAVVILGLLLLLPAGAFAALRPPSAERVKDISIITQSEVNSYTAASVTSGNVISLPAGSHVRVLEKRGSWHYVEIPGDTENLRGWIESGAATPLWIWDEKLVP